MWGARTLWPPTEQTLLDDGDPQGEVALVYSGSRALSLEMELDIAIFPGCYGSLQRQRDLRVDVGWLSRCQTGGRHGVHVGGVELGHHNAVCPGRVGHAEPEDAILETGPGVDRSEPVE